MQYIKRLFLVLVLVLAMLPVDLASAGRRCNPQSNSKWCRMQSVNRACVILKTEGYHYWMPDPGCER